MAASDHIQPYQMKLFMQAKDLMGVAADDANLVPLSDVPHITNKKVLEARRGSEYHSRTAAPEGSKTLYESIKKKGVESPVLLSVWPTGENEYKEVLRDGHHRVAAANSINPEMYIPVRYTED